MTKIRTAEEMLREAFEERKINASFDIITRESEYYPSSTMRPRIYIAMQEYAKQFIYLAAEEARTRINDESTSIIVDKESILKLKERVV